MFVFDVGQEDATCVLRLRGREDAASQWRLAKPTSLSHTRRECVFQTLDVHFNSNKLTHLQLAWILAESQLVGQIPDYSIN